MPITVRPKSKQSRKKFAREHSLLKGSLQNRRQALASTTDPQITSIACNMEKQDDLPPYLDRSSVSSIDSGLPPAYANVASMGATTHRLVRRSRWSTQAYVQANGIDRYRFAPLKGRDVRIAIYAGTSTANEALGFLDFPTTHNAFRMNFRNPAGDGVFTEVKSRIGYPHSSSFSMRSTISGRVKEYTWVNRFPGRETKPVVYDLVVDDVHTPCMATLTAEKKATVIDWTVQPKTELEQALLLLSAIGVIFRLSNKGFHHDEQMPGEQRWCAVMRQSALTSMAATG